MTRRQWFYQMWLSGRSTRKTIEVIAGNDIGLGVPVVSGPDGKMYAVKRCWAGRSLSAAKSGELAEAEILAQVGDV